MSARYFIMRKMFLLSFLLSVFVPTICFADMVGYSGDTRRYVTDAEKTLFPYNTVVRLEYWNNPDDGGTGTGTFIDRNHILTCNHVIEGRGGGKNINYYISSGQKLSGTVNKLVRNEGELGEFDIAEVISNTPFSGRTLTLADNADRIHSNLMIIGYDSLKVLPPSELHIVKQVYTDWIRKNGKITGENSNTARNDIEQILKNKYACSSNNKTNCVQCSNSESGCIFEDYRNMKVRKGCTITEIYNDPYIMFTNCPGAMGVSGAAIMDIDTNEILGIACNVHISQIGQQKDASTYGPRIEVYHAAKELIMKRNNK